MKTQIFTRINRASLLVVALMISVNSFGQIPCNLIQSPNYLDPWGGEVCFDDWPPAGEFEVNIPFTFCFYNQTFNSFFINNNGNITFDQGYNTFTAAGFPSATAPPMIAPFWGDVDTGDPGNCLGQVRYEVFPDHAVVYWDNVGVFPGTDPNQRNSFQVVISNGSSSVLPPNCNVGFIYGDMQWTTGTASGGTNGFGGTPANVGANRGDGVGYIQLGRFDADNDTYDGPFGNNDGVNFLDDAVFFFNTCIPPGGGNNIPPFAAFSGVNSNLSICDPVVICSGAARDIEFDFFPVEQNQTINAVMNPSSTPGLVLNPTITPGSICHVVAEVDAQATPPGTYTVSFTATDNGSPAASYTFEFDVIVEPPTILTAISGPNELCAGDVGNLYIADSALYTSVYWSPVNNQDYLLGVTAAGTYQAVVIDANDNCGIANYTVQVNPNPSPLIDGESIVCVSDPFATAEIYTTLQYTSYTWMNGGFPIQPGAGDTVNVSSGDYTVEVVDANGCSATSPAFTVTPTLFFLPSILGNTVTCYDVPTTLSADNVYASYSWTDLSTNPATEISQQPFIEVLDGYYSLVVTNTSGCTGTDLITVANVVPVADAGADLVLCSNVPALLGAPAVTNYTYEWSPEEILSDPTAADPTSLLSNFSLEPYSRDFFLVATNNGCEAFDTVRVTVNPQPSATFDAPDAQCYLNNSFDFEAGGQFTSAAQIYWDFGPSANPSASGDLAPQDVVFEATGSQNVTLTVVENGCSSFPFTLPVMVRAMPVANFQLDDYQDCAPFRVQFLNTSSSLEPIRETLWNFGEGETTTLENPMHQYDNPGTYSVSLRVVTEYGCSNEFFIPNLITAFPPAVSGFGLSSETVFMTDPAVALSDKSINASEVMYTTSAFDSLFFRNGEYVFADTGTYTITQIARNTFGCVDSTLRRVLVQNGYSYFIPNSFSPNGDGLNDFFTAYGNDVKTFSMEIFNRWGQIIYTSKDIESGWDGKTSFDGKYILPGIYMYQMNIENLQGELQTIKGHVQVIH